MAIKVTDRGVTTTKFEGRVLQVRRFTAVRNLSDTLDYTDRQTVGCCEALVWLGTRGFAAGKRYGGGEGYGDQVDLEFYEQFEWIDCSNLFAWRGERVMEPVEDAVVGKSEPLMFANFLAWQAWQKVQAAAAEEKRLAEAKVACAEAKRAATLAKRWATEYSKRLAAEALLKGLPAKGTRVTVKGVTGQLAWTGASKYYGKWGARAGVKDAKGVMHWFTAEDFLGR